MWASDLTWIFWRQERAVPTCLRETEPRGSWQVVGLLFLFQFNELKEWNILQNTDPFENLLCTYCVLDTMRKTPWPKINDLYPERLDKGDKIGRHRNNCSRNGQRCWLSCYRHQEPRRGTDQFQLGWAFGSEHGEMGGQVRNTHGHRHMEKSAIFWLKPLERMIWGSALDIVDKYMPGIQEALNECLNWIELENVVTRNMAERLRSCIIWSNHGNFKRSVVPRFWLRKQRLGQVK